MGRTETRVQESQVAILTGGGDKPYALGLASALVAQGVVFDFIGSDHVNGPELHNTPQVKFMNLRGDQRPGVGRGQKTLRVLKYYVQLLRYAVGSRPRVFHILWHNKFEFLDRVVLLRLYKLLGKRVVFTAHNVNARKRDGNDTWANRYSLRTQYRLFDHIFVHSERMKTELAAEFNVPDAKISVIPFGINNTLPNTSLSPAEARARLNIAAGDKVLLFFGNIAPYKGLHDLLEAFQELCRKTPNYRLVIAGRPKDCAQYWQDIQATIARSGCADRISLFVEFIPDEKVEVFFKAADVLMLPYNHVFQSGVLFLGYSFGIPAVATDTGSMKDEIMEGRTGFVCRTKDAGDICRVTERFFASDLYANLDRHRAEIRAYANEMYSWDKVGAITNAVYSGLLTKSRNSQAGA